MIRQGVSMKSEIRERMRDGTGSVEILHVFSKEDLRGKARLFARIGIGAGSSIGYHVHDQEEEVFYILSGRGVVTEDGKESGVGPGDAVLTGGGGGHSIRNDGPEALELLAVILPF